ncbi:unnamed protein product [Sphagnum jensenii]|uniref:Uncharacterized protein n=1 Tax=Sphagnum jensenii TaxID=128206 RepID=A0ABP1A3D5_9BRYO
MDFFCIAQNDPYQAKLETDRATFALAHVVAVQHGDVAVHRLDTARDNSRLRQHQRRAQQTAEQQQAARSANAVCMRAAGVA